MLSESARRVFLSGVLGADPARGVRAALERPELSALLARGGAFRRVVVLGAGKASCEMTGAALDALAARGPDGLAVAGGVVITKHGHASAALVSRLGAAGVRTLFGGHPVPDEAGCSAAGELLSAARAAAQRDTLVLNLVSGGGSALTSLPCEGLSLGAVQGTVAALLHSGCGIEEVNTVRRHITRVQGGRLAAALHPATVLSLVLSDVLGDPLHDIAGGPTVGDPSTVRDCLAVLEDAGWGLERSVPPEVLRFLRSGAPGAESLKPGDPLLALSRCELVGSNASALRACAAEATALGFHAVLLTTSLRGEAREVAKVVAALARDALALHGRAHRRVCLLFGGETTVTVRDAGGRGGRNMELALAAALELRGLAGLCVLAGGTDGQDNCAEAAGAIATGDLVLPGAHHLAEAKAALSRNDSYGWFSSDPRRAQHLLRTGPTGTNVADLLIVLAEAPGQPELAGLLEANT